MIYDTTSFNNEELSICLCGDPILVLKNWHMNIESNMYYEERKKRNEAGSLMTITVPALDKPPKIKVKITGTQPLKEYSLTL